MSRSEGEEGSVVGEDGRSRRPSRRYQVVRSAPSALVREEDGDEEEGGRMSRNRNRECYCNKILRIVYQFNHRKSILSIKGLVGGSYHVKNNSGNLHTTVNIQKCLIVIAQSSSTFVA